MTRLAALLFEQAHLFDRKKVIYASVKNTGLISNLPQTGVVEVATLVEASALLSAEGVKARIVSAPSEGLFRLQDEQYRDSVITPGIPVFCLTAGLPVTMLGFAGARGKVWGLESFGFSAAYGVLDQKLGFTGENIAKEVKKFLGK